MSKFFNAVNQFFFRSEFHLHWEDIAKDTSGLHLSLLPYKWIRCHVAGCTLGKLFWNSCNQTLNWSLCFYLLKKMRSQSNSYCFSAVTSPTLFMFDLLHFFSRRSAIWKGTLNIFSSLAQDCFYLSQIAWDFCSYTEITSSELFRLWTLVSWAVC